MAKTEKPKSAGAPDMTTFNMRVDKNLADQFKKAAKANNRTASQLLRDCMIDYVKKNRQADMFN